MPENPKEKEESKGIKRKGRKTQWKQRNAIRKKQEKNGNKGRKYGRIRLRQGGDTNRR